MGLDRTYDRIVSKAIGLILLRGVLRTSIAEVAFEAGVTRVTVHRYFGDKRGLVRAVCQRIAAVFQRASQAGPDDSMREIDGRLNQLGKEISELPSGDFLARFEEISRLYPEVYEEFRAMRQDAIDSLFQQALSAATREQSLREELNPLVLKAIFGAAVIGLLENPAVVSSNVSLAEIFTTVTEFFRHGILKDSVEGAGHGQP